MSETEPTPETSFASRHLGPGSDDLAEMLRRVGHPDIGSLMSAAVPAIITDTSPLALPPPASETTVQSELAELASRNRQTVSMIGLGYSDTVTPAVIRRNLIENPAWYTAYTPYQPEISQGRLEALLNFQTMVAELTGTEIANASLLDEATAVAEAMTLCHRQAKNGDTFLVDADCHPQTLAVVRTRADALGLTVRTADLDSAELDDVFAVLVSYPASRGGIRDWRSTAERVHAAGGLVVCATDLLACTLIRPPGEWGADVAVGSAQRFGVPMGFGGPHAGFISTHEQFARALPGRLVGVSVDAAGRPALRLALQTREQHIRRERATSNICTAQVLLAVVAAMYGSWHGPDGLSRIARRVNAHAAAIAAGLEAAGYELDSTRFFDTVTVAVPGRAAAVVQRAAEAGVNVALRDDDHVGIACDEKTTDEHVRLVLAAFDAEPVGGSGSIPAELARTSEFMAHPVFSSYRSETEMMRYLRRLSDADLALDRTMIPLGSCTMKLNSAVEMEPISWPGFANIHPFAPPDQTAGYRELIAQLSDWLADITGYDAVSVQPNAGSQGELAGLLAIRAYHDANGDHGRRVCLIPSSAHGTNAASAVMAAMRVVVVDCDADGNVDLDDLRSKVTEHSEELAALMVTYPSTHGVFETAIREICGLVHDHGGQVYLDGANLNALVGYARPGHFGADVSHLNLHKTFCIPHGGGGPGVGPVAARSHLAPFLPNHPLDPDSGPETGPGPVSAAPYGSAGILPISWAYIRLMGEAGLREATEYAICAANYVAARLADHYDVLYTGQNGLVAHECIIDIRPFRSSVTADDVAKRLIDFGFHAPTMSFPVAGTLMVEPTESESLAELDRFCDAMIAIRGEIDAIEAGTWPAEDNPLVNAPHTAEDLLVEDWTHPYSREHAAYPGKQARLAKYWPPVSRIDNAHGDRNLACSCPPIEDLAEVTD